MSHLSRVRLAVPALLLAALVSVMLSPAGVRAQGPFDGISASEELTFSLLSTKSTDASGATTKTDILSYGSRTTFGLNYNLLPKLNLNAGGTYEKDIADVLTGPVTGETEITRLRPYVWLSLRDPVLGGDIGYSLLDDSVKPPGQSPTALIRETYTGQINWRPAGLPATLARYIHTTTRDDPKTSLDTDEDQIYLKAEYLLRDLSLYYAGTYVNTNDKIRDVITRQLTHEGKFLYATTFLDGRVLVTSDNRLRVIQVNVDNGIPAAATVGPAISLSVPGNGLSALDDTPLNDPLSPNAALSDGELTAGAGINIGFPGLGGDFRRRNVGLDFGTAVPVGTLRVWVDGFGPSPLPADITNSFSWEVYVSSDNLTWTLHTTVAAASFGPFDRRFEIVFPAVSTRYIKVVTRPLSGGIIGSTNSSLFPTILITEVQAFASIGSPGNRVRTSITQVLRSHNLDVKVFLFQTPSLYYRFNGDYLEFDPDAQRRYNVSNGLYYTQVLTPILSASANASFEFGEDRQEQRKAALYYASLAATPLPTLTDSLAVSGNIQWQGGETTSNNSIVLYNTAQLYRGIDASLQLGANFISNTDREGASSQRRELYVNVGTGITPHRTLSMTAYYLGKLSHASGAQAGDNPDTTENRFDVAVSFNPVRSIFLTAGANIVSETGKPTSVTQNYGLSWTPFPDGNLQFSIFYAETHLPDNTNSRIIQPTLRWYLTSRRRSYFEASYQHSTTEGDALKTESQLVSGRLNFYY